MNRKPLVLLAVGTLIVLVSILGGPAYAGCHRFEVQADDTVQEGASLVVTVTRDGSVAPSSIDLVVVDGSARRGPDVNAQPRYTASFPSGGTSQRFTLRIVDDTAAEGNETFNLRLENPRGCAVNPNYAVGQPVTVTIAASDQAASPTATVTATVTPAPVADDGGAPLGLIILLVVLAVLGIGWALMRARAKARPGGPS